MAVATVITILRTKLHTERDIVGQPLQKVLQLLRLSLIIDPVLAVLAFHRIDLYQAGGRRFNSRIPDFIIDINGIGAVLQSRNRIAGYVLIAVHILPLMLEFLGKAGLLTGVLGGEKVEKGIHITPVSYTHLDVYKRQLPHRAADPPPAAR